MSVDLTIGFTGTRQGMTAVQYDAALTVMRRLCDGRRVEVHHGDCIGADDELHGIASELGCVVVVRPGINPPHLCAGCRGAIRHDPESNMTRNRYIVAAADLMLAAPSSRPIGGVGNMQVRGGTFATIRMAIRASKPLLAIWPDGLVDAGGEHALLAQFRTVP